MRAAFRFIALSAAIPLGLSLALAPPAAARAGSFVAISGSGSSFSSLAIDLWAEGVRPRGLVVNYNPDGSATGRADYIANQDDFAASDVPFRTSPDKLAGLGAEHPPQGYSYVPAPASGVAFFYHLTVGGQPVTNLRLSGSTVMKIFTGQITNWDDPQITRDYGRRLPNLPITPVLNSDLDGTTFYLTSWLAAVFPQQWNAFCKKVNPRITLPCGPSVAFPAAGNAKSEVGSNNVLTFIRSSSGNGAIGYAEAPYGFASHMPELELGNAAGDFVRPAAANVTASLSRASINENRNSPHFMQVDLAPVYTSKDPADYPLSFTSYLIVPRRGTTLPANFSKAKGRTLSTFLIYALCAGQLNASKIGYARLPQNLVKGGLLQVANIPGHVHVPAECPAALRS
jgi:ABC-type phosphate transport system substrate-binding protein